MKNEILIFGMIIGLLMACSNSSDEEQEKFKQETIEMDSIQQDLESSVMDLEEGIEEDLQAVDSLLEGLD